MKELIEVIAKSLVDHPSEVVVTETVSGDDLPQRATEKLS